MVSLLVAYAHNGVIGKDNDLPWYLPADLKRFKELTTGKTVVMGRKTFDSIITRNGKPLPNRTNVVITRDPSYHAEGAEVVHTIQDALTGSDEVFVIGGAEIFKQALPLADQIYATEIDADIEGDVYFPEIDKSVWRQAARESHQADEKNRYNYSYVTYEKTHG
nr:Dihydrofolate reductase [uncultured bacterium]